jgi:sugar phosphate isomerase/epimerase
MDFTRRDVGRIALGCWPAARLFGKPDSKFNGVQIGINAPYSFRGMPGSADDVIRDVLQLGLNSVELRAQPVEHFLGGPVTIQKAAAPGSSQQKKGFSRPTPEQEEALRAQIEEIRKWRLALPRDKFKVARKKFEDEGIFIDIVKIDDFTNRIDNMEDNEIDYCFEMTKALGARAISCEPPVSKTQRLGAFAAKHQLRIGYHGHLSKDPGEFAQAASWEKAYSYSKYNAINLDIGHYKAAGGDPVAFIKQYHERITHIHLKDRKADDGPNMPWGQGDTPVKEILQLMRKERYPFQATIEFEYTPPEGSDVMTEIGKCVRFCKDALA